MSALTNLERLKRIGFVLAGSWRCENDLLQLQTTSHDSAKNIKSILYALVVGSDVMYIGKSVLTFRKRMHGYCNPGPTQFTNIRNNREMRRALAENTGDQGKPDRFRL